jgi:SAM-dependent methyltransferase
VTRQPDELERQPRYWESVLSDNPDMYGLKPSEAATAAVGRFLADEAHDVLELGAGQGRDTLFLAEQGLSVTALDSSASGLAAIRGRAEELGVEVQRVRHDVRDGLPFPDGTFDACYSHMLFCMALTTTELDALVDEVHRVLRPGGLVAYTARTTDDAHYGDGTDHGGDLHESGGFIVHFFSRQLVERLARRFEIIDTFDFEEGDLPRRLVSVTMRRR